MTGPLAGVRIVDLTSIVLGPYGTQMLGDAGADIIKVEPPGGEMTRAIGPHRSPDQSAYYANLNRNKRSLVLDLKRPEARAALLRVIEGADVFVHNMRAGAAARLGLDATTLLARFPKLIHASASGFRLGSSKQDDPAFDDLIQGMCGLASLNGAATGADGPRYVPSVMADKISGHTLATAITMALFARERAGVGQAVHVPMLDTMLAFLLPEHLWGKTIDDDVAGLGYPRLLTPHRRPYATKDGYLCIIAATNDQWQRLFTVLGRAELIRDPRFADMAARTTHIDALYGVVAELLPTRTTAAWLADLATADLPHGPAHTLDSLFDDPYLAEVNAFPRFQHPTEGEITMIAPAVNFTATPLAIRTGAPGLGAHSAEILREAGLSEAEIAMLAA